jgi:RNA-directed DNA polymerase
MESIREFLERRLKLKVKEAISAVDRPSKRKFLGYSMTCEKRPRLKVAPQSVQRLKGKLREVFRKGRGRNMGKVMEELTVILRGWQSYFKPATEPYVRSCERTMRGPEGPALISYSMRAIG